MSTNTQQQNKRNDIGGLWKKVSQSGSEYMSGSVDVNGEKVQIVVFPNIYKKAGERTPDFKILVSEPKAGAANETPTSKPEAKNTKNINKPQDVAADASIDDEIPF